MPVFNRESNEARQHVEFQWNPEKLEDWMAVLIFELWNRCGTRIQHVYIYIQWFECICYFELWNQNSTFNSIILLAAIGPDNSDLIYCCIGADEILLTFITLQLLQFQDDHNIRFECHGVRV